MALPTGTLFLLGLLCHLMSLGLARDSGFLSARKGPGGVPWALSLLLSVVGFIWFTAGALSVAHLIFGGSA
ncbi:hypothetical protein [Rhodovulum sp. 12E13]|uniref:hypothetical protein n=1 Tax=Rhodovulum sp. 12E13 TaxID=2203891 RepID=UPI0011C07BB1|nr:hypothetical protein [Rhodovulum sp. 12E13]